MSEPRYGIWIPVYGNCGVMNQQRSLEKRLQPLGISVTWNSQPIFATLARNFDVDVNILSGVMVHWGHNDHATSTALSTSQCIAGDWEKFFKIW
ncbi:hypothetical protein JYQ62_28670 [Nostoc sp. UHCC 0702]|nr:hypothetical protein JYQ62_28670 [Nostoc sp. UHCC 0702]